MAVQPPRTTTFVAGGQLLSELEVRRFNLLLTGSAGTGKSTSAVGFGGGDYGKVIYFLIEHGQKGGAGGALPLKFLKGINDGIGEDEILVLRVESWAQMQAQHKWLKENANRLYTEGYRVLVCDGISELCMLLEDAFTKIAPGTKASEAEGNQMLQVITDIDAIGGRMMEQRDYGFVARRLRSYIKETKKFPFTFLATALDGPLYDENQRGEDATPIGIGPDVTGRKLANKVCQAFDFVFHCTRKVTKTRDPKTQTTSVSESYLWLTKDHTRGVGQPPYFAKARSGKALSEYEAADGRAVLKKLGFVPDPGESTKLIEAASEAAGKEVNT